jgi:type IV pilus assembly protein PilB
MTPEPSRLPVPPGAIPRAVDHDGEPDRRDFTDGGHTGFHRGVLHPGPEAFTGMRAALVITTHECLEESEPSPDAILRDTNDIAAVLGDPDGGAFTVTSLLNRTTQEIRLGIEDFLAERTAGDQMLIYVSGRALLDARRRLFFAGTDTRSDRLASTSVEAGWLAERLAECPAQRQIVILDTDHSGSYPGPAAGRPATEPDAPGRARAILTSSGPDPTANDDPPETENSGTSFTHRLVQGLRSGAADVDADGFVTIEDAYAYIQRLTGPGRRRPHRWMTGGGSLVLARTPRSIDAAPPVADADTPPPDHRAAHVTDVTDLTDLTDATTVGPCPRIGPVPIAMPNPRTPLSPDLTIVRTPDVGHALKVAQALDPAQALAAVQGLDAAEVIEVAQVLEIAQVLQAGAVRPPRGTDRPVRPGSARRPQIGEILVENGVITSEQLDLALTTQRQSPGPHCWIGKVVVDLGLASEHDVAESLADLLHLDVIDLSKVVPAPDMVRLLPRAVAERTRVLVIDRTPGGELVVAACDPTNVVAFDDVRLYTRSTDLKVYVATDSQIRDQLNRAWSLGSDSSQVADIVQEVAGTNDEPKHWLDTSDEDAPIVRLVSQILGDGVRLRASDIHIEVQRDTLRVRYRVDGLLREVMEAPRRVAASVISRIKIISGLDIAERRIPQDGRTRFSVEGTAIDARVSTLPSLHGEKVVIRLLTRGDDVPSLPSLGLEPDQLLLVEAALAVPQGLMLITGPTGSGKTNTLYSAIAKIRSPELNIVTLEDPIEVQIPGITQVGVNEKTGMTFSRGLRSILRQDPDIILVGEVRDGETAQLALKAALTGHMVLTTLHTNSAVAALTRLVDMGAEPFIIASSLTISIAQRLVRRPCQTCIAPYQPDDVTLALLGLVPDDLANATPRKGTGCHECGDTGYRGRTAAYEVLNIDGPMRQVLLKEPTESAITAQAQAAGMVTLRAAAILKALQGKTTFEEAVRVTSR